MLIMIPLIMLQSLPVIIIIITIIPSLISPSIFIMNLILLLLVLLIPLSNPVISTNFKQYFPHERDGLLQLRDSTTSSANLHTNWTGPPCIGDFSRWAGIGCSNWHVIHLVLDGIQLTGSLPPSFLLNLTFLTLISFKNNSIFGPLPNLTNLVHLENIFLSYNRFTGSIPYHYTQLPNLKTLELQLNYLEGEIPAFDQNSLSYFNVSYNNLQGLIPSTVVLRRFPSSCFDHNPDLCGFPLQPCPVLPPAPAVYPPPEQDNKKNIPIWIIILIAVAAVLLPFLVVFLFLCYYRKMQSKQTGREAEPGDRAGTKLHNFRRGEEAERREELEFFERDITVFDLDDLLRASAEVLGKGINGTTYKANLELSGLVAVKRLHNMNDLSKKDFILQMQLLGKLRHQNLAKIISFYYSKEEKLLIYEYVPDGNLFDLLHENRGVGRVALNWSERLCIIKDIAKGLEFLHRSLPNHRVPHANLKSSNVLIYKNAQTYHSKLTNYGFLPVLPSKKFSQTLAINRSPEFSQRKKLTQKTDIYCFGIVLLEIITGRIPEEENGRDKIEDLSDWVKSVVNNDWSTDILDVEILGSRDGHDQMLKLTEIALECTDFEPRNRPKITQLLSRIQEIELSNTQYDS